MSKSCGIYMIENLVNCKKYIGQSKHVNQRWNEHTCELKGNRHCNAHLQRAWNKYGEDNFMFTILEYCYEELLNEKEQYWIRQYNSMNSNFGYNKTSGGGAGIFVSEETKKKLSLAHSGKNNYFYGKTHSKETKEIISQKAKLRLKDKTKIPLYGKKMSEETKKKLSASKIGRFKGENSYNAKLNNNSIREIKWLLVHSYLSEREIAQQYSISVSNIYSIKNLKVWENVGAEHNEILKSVSGELFNCSIKLIIEAKLLLANTTLTLNDIVQKINIDRKTLIKINKLILCKNLFPELNDKILNRVVEHSTKGIIANYRLLSIEEVTEIKELLLEKNLSQLEIAKLYDVGQTLISDIKNLKAYKNVASELNDFLLCRKYKNITGESNKTAKLNDKMIYQIKQMYVESLMSSKKIGEYFHVSESCILSILNKETWKHIETPYDEQVTSKLKNKINIKNRYTNKLDEDRVKEIKQLLKKEMFDIKQIVTMFNVSESTIYQIMRGKTWVNVIA